VSQRPKLSMPQRRRDLLHRRVGDGVVILDTATNEAMALEPSVAVVWMACDGTANPQVVAEQTGLTPDQLNHSIVALSTTGLLEPEDSSEPNVISRRAVLGAGAGLSAGVMASVLLPTPAMASSAPGGGVNTNPAGPTASAASASATEAGALSTNTTSNQVPLSHGSSPQSSQSRGLAFTGEDSKDRIEAAVGLIAAGATIVAANQRGRLTGRRPRGRSEE
jgi:hypothetical protein